MKKKRPDSALLQKKWRNKSSNGDFFSKHFGLIHLAGLRVLKHFLEKNHLYLFISPFILSLFFFILSLLFSFIFSLLFRPVSSCLAHSLFLSSLFSSFDLLLSCLLFSSLVFSFLYLSCLSFSVSLCLSLFLSVSLCFCLSLSLCLSVSVSTCGTTCGRGANTHGDVLNLHTETFFHR